MKFVKLFKKIDINTNGIINGAEFELLLKQMNLEISDLEVSQLLEQIDPFHNQKITFSECVALFTYESLASTENSKMIMEVFNSMEE